MSDYDLDDEISLVDDTTNTTTTALAEYSQTAAALNALRTRLVGIVYDVTTTKGMEAARRDRAEVRDLRVALEKMRVSLKAPALERSRLIDTEAKRITSELEEIEKPIHQQIKAEEDRKAKEKADREAAEFGRVLAMQEAVGELSMMAMAMQGKSAALIAERLDLMRSMPMELAVYQEMLSQAEAARTAAVSKLETMLKAQQWDEAEAARRLAEQEQRQREQAAADAERARVAEEQRAERERQAAEAKRLKDAADALAAQMAAFDARVKAEQAEKDAAALKAAEPDAQTNIEGRDSQHVLKAEAETPDATDRESPATASPSVGSMGAGQPADAGAIGDAPEWSIEQKLYDCREALVDALELLEGWIATKCPRKFVAEHMAHVAKLRKQGGINA